MSDKTAPTTLKEIEAMPSDTLKPADVATYLHACPNTICNAAKMGLLPWAYRLGARTVIPKAAFVYYHKYGQTTAANIPEILLRAQGRAYSKEIAENGF